MSEIILVQRKQTKAGVRRMKKVPLKIDMTPMVDLGFLLVTFFIFTAKISEPQETDLFMPANGDSTKIEDSKVLTALLGKDNRIFVYPGRWQDALKNHTVRETTYYVKDGLGSDVRKIQNQLDQFLGIGGRKEFILLIKPGEEATYQNIIDVLDEVLINNVKKYAITGLNSDEETYLKKRDL